MLLKTLIAAICFVPNLALAELGARPTFGIGIYGGAANQAVIMPNKQSSLVMGTAEMTFGAHVSETSSWHLALQSVSLQGPLADEHPAFEDDHPSQYDGFRVGGRYIRHFGRVNLILGLGAGSLAMQNTPGPYRAMTFISPEVGLGVSFYKSERVSWDITMMNSLYLSEGLAEIPKSMFAPQIGLNFTMAVGAMSPPVFVHVGDGAVRGLGYLLYLGGKSGLFAARGMFTVLRGIR